MMMGAPRYTPWVCGAVGWSDSGLIYRRGVPGFFDGNGGLLSAEAWRLFMDQVDLMDQMDKMGAPWYTPRVCGAAVWFGSGEDLPQGYAGFF